MPLHNPSIIYIIQACSDFSNNTLNSDLTHPDIYNLVGFSGACTCGGYPCSPPSYVLQVLQCFQSPTHKV